MNVVGRFSSFIPQGGYSVATPFHPFSGAVDIIAVEQNDDTFRSTPWYVRFGKFQGVLKGAEKLVRIEVNGVEANFHMHLDNSGEAYFVREVDPDKVDSENIKDSDSLEGGRDDNNSTDYSNIESGSKDNEFFDEERDGFNNGGMDRLERMESDADRNFYEFQDEQSSLEGSVEFSEYGSNRYDNLEYVEHALESKDSSSEVVLVSVDGHILMAPISSPDTNAENVKNTPQFHLGPGERTEEFNRGDDSWTSDYLNELDSSARETISENACEENKETETSEHVPEPSRSGGEHPNMDKDICVENSSEGTIGTFNRSEVFKSCLELTELSVLSANDDQGNTGSLIENLGADNDTNSKNDEKPEEGNVEITRDNDESSPHDLGDPINVSMPELQVEVVTDERNALDMALNSSENLHVRLVTSNQRSPQKVESPDSDASTSDHVEPQTARSFDYTNFNILRLEISLCGTLLQPGMGSSAAEDVFNANRISSDEFRLSGSSIVKNEDLIVRLQGKYLSWDKAAHIILGSTAFGLDIPIEVKDAIPVEPEMKSGETSTPSRRWRLWPIPFRRVKTLEHRDSNSSNEEVLVHSESAPLSRDSVASPKECGPTESLPRKQIVRTNVPTSDQIASLNLEEGQNMVNFVFSTSLLGSQKVVAHIYLWKWNTRIVISDVDGTIIKSDVLGQFMPLVGKDWTHSGIAHLFSAIKENGYQLLFLSARAIFQAYLTKSFLFNLKQDGKSLPNGPVVISPDGLFPSLYREVIRRAPHELKIACLEDIKALFPPDYNPFYAGFGNRDTDELSYLKIGIPRGKIFIINPKGEVAINHRIDVKSYTSLHTLVNDMFPPTSLVEQEDYNSWNYWKMPLPEIDNL